MAALAILAAAAAVAASDPRSAGASSEARKAFERTQFAVPRKPVPTFELTDQDGKPFRLEQLRKRWSLVFFGFTNCNTVCPATLTVLRQVHRELAKEGSAPSIVLLSVDGDRDTPAAMKRYLTAFGDGFVGLTGSPDTVRDIAAGFSAVFFKGAPGDRSGNYQVEHTSQVYLLDPDGKLAATFYGASAQEIAAVVRLESAQPRASAAR
jgi:protein SCO1/2